MSGTLLFTKSTVNQELTPPTLTLAKASEFLKVVSFIVCKKLAASLKGHSKQTLIQKVPGVWCKSLCK